MGLGAGQTAAGRAWDWSLSSSARAPSSSPTPSSVPPFPSPHLPCPALVTSGRVAAFWLGVTAPACVPVLSFLWIFMYGVGLACLPLLEVPTLPSPTCQEDLLVVRWPAAVHFARRPSPTSSGKLSRSAFTSWVSHLPTCSVDAVRAG